MITVIDKTQDDLQRTDEHVKKLQNYVVKVEQYINRHISIAVSNLNTRLNLLDLDLRINVLFNIIEELLLIEYRKNERYVRMKASVELGRLSRIYYLQRNHCKL